MTSVMPFACAARIPHGRTRTSSGREPERRGPRGEDREPERDGVGEHVARVREERQGVGENTEDHLGRHEGEQEGERERQEAAIAARRVRVAVGEHVAHCAAASSTAATRSTWRRTSCSAAAARAAGLGTRQPGGGAQADLDRLG